MQTPIAIDSRQFRNALGSFTTGVTIVTTVDAAGNDIGLTANSFNSVSLDPPLVLWSLAKTSKSMAAFMQAEHFAVHILAVDQQELSDRFAKRGAEKFAGLELERGPGGIPLLAGCTARFQCKTAFQYAGGDHEIFVGQVVAFDHLEKKPLVFHGGRYGILFKEEGQAAQVSPDESEGSFNQDFLGYLLGSAYHALDRRIKTDLAQQGLGYDEYLTLSILTAEDNRTCEDVNELLNVAERTLDDALTQRLTDRGFIIHERGTHPSRLRLTPAGRETAIQLMAGAKAAEADLLGNLEYDEAQLLKQLLHRVVRRSGSKLPPLWRKQHSDK